MGETRETLEPQNKRRYSQILHQVPELQARECKTEANGLVGILGEEKNRTGKHRTHNVQ